MASQHQWSSAFEWNPPATPAEIALAEDEHGRPLPAAYVALVTVYNGGFTPSSLSILEVGEIVQRNADYEVSEYMPGYLMIGDDGGGTAILLNEGDGRIYEVDMGVMDESEATLSAHSLDELLEFGTGLADRGPRAS